MDAPPLTLDVTHLTPHTLFPTSQPHSPSDVPLSTTALPSPGPPEGFTLSPTHNYPAPFGAMSLGSTLGVGVTLSSRLHEGAVMGVRMMLEIQGPGGRYRLGEIIHGEEPRPDDKLEKGSDTGDGDKVGDLAQGSHEGESGVTGVSGESGESGQGGENDIPGPQQEGAAERLSELMPGESVSLDVSAEMKEVGLQILICSVAWETLDGRRTFQRFFKFNVNPPLSIKTRIHTSLSANASLDPQQRSDVHLEVLMQNISSQGILFDRVLLEPVWGLSSRPIGSSSGSSIPPTTSTPPASSAATVFGGGMATLLPSDSRQYLFLLSPTDPDPVTGKDSNPTSTSAATSATTSATTSSPLPASVFPPTFSPGTILPLGRLDVSWFSGPYRDRGRLQTSTLNRRVPITPIAPKTSASTPGLIPSRTMSAAPPSPAGGARAGAVSPRPSGPPLPTKEEDDVSRWEYDLAVLSLEREGVEVEQEFTATIRLGIRDSRSLPTSLSAEDDADTQATSPKTPPPPLNLAIQYLSTVPLAVPSAIPSSTTPALAPAFAFQPPSRSSTPAVSSPATPGPGPVPGPGSAAQPPPNRVLSPRTGTPSRPMTPMSSQLRQATSSHITSGLSTPLQYPTTPVPAIIEMTTPFPPPPTLSRVAPPKRAEKDTPTLVGQVQHLGASMVILPKKEFTLVREQYETTYAESSEPNRRWEAVYEMPLRFIALQEGLAALGGVRLLQLEDDDATRGLVGKEWDSLGDVWVTG